MGSCFKENVEATAYSLQSKNLPPLLYDRPVVMCLFLEAREVLISNFSKLLWIFEAKLFLKCPPEFFRKATSPAHCVSSLPTFFFFLVDLLHIRLRKSAQVSWRYLWAVMCLSEFCTLTPVSPHLHFLHRVSLRMESLSSQLRRELSSALKGMRNSPYSPFCAVSRCNRCTKIIFGIAVSNGMSYM